MSSPLNLTAEQLRKISSALDDMADITRAHGVSLCPYGRQQLGLEDNVLAFSWDGSAYVIDDSNGD
ncbi:hypothetical protein [Streptomyces sp. NRRL B-1347]|uniref:hypothetical protein n=1 Tax=Streptomyces sp. NRRL B-1347 TaxID=1476877 RepID=UPI0004CA8AB3|nr:hypothetical protein [Streptomyces sp. NRRL B-1347]